MCLPRREKLKSVRSLIKAKDGAVRFCGVEMPPETVDGLRAVRRAAFAASQLTEESCRSLRMLGLVEPAPGAISGEGADAMRDGASLKLTVLGALLLRVLERPEAIRENANTTVTVFPADPAVYALEASAAIALSRLFADRREETLAIELAFQAGYASYPNPEPSPFVAGDIALAKNWKAGWGQREYELRRSRERTFKPRSARCRRRPTRDVASSTSSTSSDSPAWWMDGSQICETAKGRLLLNC
jgi:hypothetical protein